MKLHWYRKCIQVPAAMLLIAVNAALEHVCGINSRKHQIFDVFFWGYISELAVYIIY